MEKQALFDYRNFMLGDDNRVGGIKNVILGSRNTLIGNRNWLFTADYAGRSDHTLVLDKWRINLDQIEKIKVDPSLAISQW
jgi:hypothetical protein